MLANQLSEISVPRVTIRFDTPPQKHISVRRLIDEEVNRIVRRVTDADVHVHAVAVHFALRRRAMFDNDKRSGCIMKMEIMRAIRTTMLCCLLLHADSLLRFIDPAWVIDLPGSENRAIVKSRQIIIINRGLRLGRRCYEL